MSTGRIVGLMPFVLAVVGCAAMPTEGFGIEQTNSLPSQACQRVGRIEGKSYLGAGIVGAGSGHYHSRRAALEEAPASLVAKATHVVWDPPAGFGVDMAIGVLFSCPKG
jgi:hypothetical protein